MTSLRLKKRLQDRSIKEVADEYIHNSRVNNRSVWTIKTYTEKFGSFIKFIGEDVLCKDITEKTIEEYKKFLLKTNIESSVNSYLNHVGVLFRYAKLKGYMKEVNVTKLKAQERQKRVYSKEDLEELLREEPNESFVKYQTRIIIATFVSTGLRLSELTSLQVKDVDLDNLVIYSRHTKTGKSRLLPISTSLRVLLTEWLRFRRHNAIEDTLFCNSYGEPLKQSTLRTAMRRYCKDKGVKDNSIHQFRRTFITHSVNQGVDILSLSRITGHQNLSILNKYYVANKERVVSLANIVSPLEGLNIVKRKKRVSKFDH